LRRLLGGKFTPSMRIAPKGSLAARELTVVATPRSYVDLDQIHMSLAPFITAAAHG
jgi:hypothetical protein